MLGRLPFSPRAPLLQSILDSVQNIPLHVIFSIPRNYQGEEWIIEDTHTAVFRFGGLICPLNINLIKQDKPIRIIGLNFGPDLLDSVMIC